MASALAQDTGTASAAAGGSTTTKSFRERLVEDLRPADEVPSRQLSGMSSMVIVRTTRLLSTGAVCDQPYCDGFASISCFKPDPVTKVFMTPKISGSRLDLCADWATGCGEPAATQFCQAEGWAMASAFEVAQDIGASTPTRLIGTGAVCDQGFCDGFASITCKN